MFAYFNVINDYISGAEYQINCAYARSFLKKSGIDSIQYINRHSKRYYEYINDLLELDADNYLFFINEYNYSISRLIINKLKIQKPQCNISIFGPSSDYIAKFLYNDLHFDVAFLKHEYFSILKMISGEKYGDIENIAFRNNDSMIYTSILEHSYSLDDLGLPYSDGMIPPEEAVNVGMISSLGCYGNCSFCSYSDKKKVFYAHSIENIIKELDYISEYIGGNNCDMRFFDDCFSLNTKRTEELLKEMKKKNYSFKFWCCVRGDLLSKEIIDLMGELNFQKVVIGLESASPEVLAKLGKIVHNQTPEEFLEMLLSKYKYARERGINPILSLNFGLPFESLNDAKKTINFAVGLNNPDGFSCCYTTCFPNSKIFEESEKYGATKVEAPFKLPYRSYYKNYDMKEIYDLLYSSRLTKEVIDSYKLMVEFKLASFVTGLFKDTNYSGYFDMIEIRQNSKETNKFIDENITINGTVLIDSEELKITKNYYCDNRKFLKYELPLNDKNLLDAYNEQTYLPDQMFIKKTEKGIIWQYNNLYLRGINVISYEKTDRNKIFKLYTEQAEQLRISHKFNTENLEKWTPQNICMFTENCSLCSMRKISLNGENVCTCCSGDVIGNINENYSKLLSNIRKIRDDIIRKRNCSDCSAKSWCSQCMYPSEFGGEKIYCDFVKNNKEIILYIRILSALKILIQRYNSFIRKEISVYWNKSNICMSSEYKISDSNILVEESGNYYILNLQNPIPFKIERKKADLLKDLFDEKKKISEIIDDQADTFKDFLLMGIII